MKVWKYTYSSREKFDSLVGILGLSDCQKVSERSALQKTFHDGSNTHGKL